MSGIDMNSMRILIDLQPCQTESASRGMGRYSEALAVAINEIAKPREIYALLSAEHEPRPKLENFDPSQILMTGKLPDLPTERFHDGGERDAIDRLLHSGAISELSPDVIHVSSVFERKRVALPKIVNASAGQVLSATLHDLIPLRFPELYFNNTESELRYRGRLAFLYEVDLLLANSEASRQDAIELLRLKPEKIVTIMGGVAKHFKPPTDRAAVKARLFEKYGLKKPGALLYTGGDDPRKNLIGAIRGYAKLPHKLRAENQLLIICGILAHRKEFFLHEARKAGLNGDDVSFLGFVQEEDLVGFYGICDLFFFPSLYEGLGMPVLEAMACGAPTICSNNSSLKELIDRTDATFDASDPESIAERLRSVLEDKEFADELREYGLKRSKLYTWEASARKALSAFDNAIERKRDAMVAAARAQISPKLRMAILTPLPPCQSGIADYNAAFAPYLSRHFDIDFFVDGYRCSSAAINSAHRIFDAADFRANAASYDALLYELGNSEFHAHMLALLDEFPGVVMLHDAFLSGLMGYLEFDLGEPNRLSREMIYSHGSLARRVFAPIQENPDPGADARLNLPCSKGPLDKAIGVISHTKYNLELARAFYPRGLKAPYRIIPHMAPVAPRKSPAERAAIRRDLGFGANDFLITTFGHIDRLKCSDRILQAFIGSALAQNEDCHLIFAGKLWDNDFCRNLAGALKESKIRNRVKITGYLSDEDYQNHLAVTDLAIQLRTNSRGGMSGALIGAMSHGLPVIVNHAASFKDFPSDVVAKLSPEPSWREIAETLETLYRDEAKRRSIGERGLEYVKRVHDPVELAAQYAAAICEFVNRSKSSSTEIIADRLAPHLAQLDDSAGAAKSVAQFLASREKPNFARTRLIVDCSHIARIDHGSGIQRVVREIVRELYCSARHGFEALGARRIDDRIFPANDWLNQRRLLLPYELEEGKLDPVEFRRSDHLLMLDSSWHDYGDFEAILIAARKKRAPIVNVVHDLFAIRSPSWCAPGMPKVVEEWLRRAIATSDGLVCVSKATADDLIDFIEENKLAREGLKIGWWHLGSNPRSFFDANSSDFAPEATSAPYALMVGTIEPRKNHAIALDAFEELWDRGFDLSLVIAGKLGWRVDELAKRILEHKEFRKRLFWFESATDSEISALYKKASIFLFISKGEGFGLPLVEASHYGLPIVCSRIPSFVEIARNNVIYAQTESPESLANDLERAWDLIQSGSAPKSAGIKSLTWEESAENLLKVIIDQNWYKVF